MPVKKSTNKKKIIYSTQYLDAEIERYVNAIKGLQPYSFPKDEKLLFAMYQRLNWRRLKKLNAEILKRIDPGFLERAVSEYLHHEAFPLEESFPLMTMKIKSMLN